MATSLHINGEATVNVAPAGQSLSLLGQTIDGVTFTINPKFKEVFIDTYGDQVPYDRVWCGVRYFIDMELINYDTAVLSTVMQNLIWVNATAGQLGSIGTLMVTQGKYMRLEIASPKYSQPLNFPIALLVDSDEWKYNATDPIAPKLRWEALPSQQTSDSLNALMQNNATS